MSFRMCVCVGMIFSRWLQCTCTSDSRLADISLHTKTATGTYQLQGTHEGVVGAIYTFNMSSVTIAKYVKIQNPPSTANVLNFCEVEIMGYALHKGCAFSCFSNNFVIKNSVVHWNIKSSPFVFSMFINIWNIFLR